MGRSGRKVGVGLVRERIGAREIVEEIRGGVKAVLEDARRTLGGDRDTNE